MIEFINSLANDSKSSEIINGNVTENDEKIIEETIKEETMEEQISKNFTLSELTYSATAKAKGLSNVPSESDYANMKALCENILQPLRDKLGKPISINSCYRGKVLNEAVGGSKTSQHMTGSAADIHVKGMNMYELATYIKNNFKFDQLILEYSEAPNYTNGWVHVSWNNGGTQRKQCLTINKSGTKIGF